MPTSLHSLACKRMAQANVPPTPVLMTAIGEAICGQITPTLLRELMRKKFRGLPRVDAPGTAVPRECPVDRPDVDRRILGFVLNREGQELDVEEWRNYLRELRNLNAYYIYRYKALSRSKRSGTPVELPRTRKVRLKRRLEAFLVTCCPWHGAYLLSLVAFRTVFRALAVEVMDEFEAVTGLRVVGIAAHLGEGCPHFHVVFSRVDLSGRRVELKATVGRGRRSLGCIGIGQVCAMRRGLAGLERGEGWRRVYSRCLKYRQDNGKLPLDWRMSRFLDARIAEQFPAAPNPGGGGSKP